jgi:dCTP deaminase
LLQPHQFVLAETLEEFKLPDCIAGQLALKSSRAREGIEHLLAGYIDPGYCGRLTLELQNARSMHPVALWPGMRIAQIVFHRMTMLPSKDYSHTGRLSRGQSCSGFQGMSDSKSGFGFPYEVESVVDHPPHYCVRARSKLLT